MTSPVLASQFTVSDSLLSDRLRGGAKADLFFRSLGGDKYGFGAARSYFLVVRGKRYDSKAIAGVARGLERPDLGSMRHGLSLHEERS